MLTELLAAEGEDVNVGAPLFKIKGGAGQPKKADKDPKEAKEASGEEDKPER